MEATIFGLPMTTVVLFTGIPALIMALLVWWGISYRNMDENDARTEGRGK